MTEPAAARQETPAHRWAGVHVDFWTDPLCCWSWAMEPHWRRLLAEVGAGLRWRYRMGGMIPDWGGYEDPLNAVSRPAQLGPVWMQARHMTGAEIDDRVWALDPPRSSIPACAAVKAAELQGREAAELYFRAVRTMLMREGRNIARHEVLAEAAQRVEAEHPARFDRGRFLADLGSPAALDALREDLMQARYHDIGRFPTLILRSEGRPSLMLVGYRPYEVLRAAMEEACGRAPAS